MNQLIPVRSEQYLIAAVMCRAHALDEIDGLRSTDFGHFGHAQIWAKIEQHADNLDVDVILAWAYDDAGDAVGSCLNTAITAWAQATDTSNLALHVELVRQKAVTRAVISVAGDVLHKGRGGDLQGSALLAHAQQTIGAVALTTTSSENGWSLAEMIRLRLGEYDEIEARRAAGGHVGGVPTGFRRWDKLGGVPHGIVTVLCARPGMGKTAVAQSAVAAALAGGFPVHWISLEEGRESFTDRLLARVVAGTLSVTRLRRAECTRQEMADVVAAATQIIQDWGKLLRFDSMPGATAADVVLRVRACRRKAPWKHNGMVVVDYLQKMGAIGSGTWDLYSNIVQNLSHLDAASNADGWAYLVLSQVKRECEDRKNKRPQIRDLFGGDTIGQYAKQIVAPFRPEYYDDTAPRQLMELNCLKFNDGPANWTIPLGWDGPRTRAYDLVQGEHCFECGATWPDNRCTHARDTRENYE